MSPVAGVAGVIAVPLMAKAIHDMTKGGSVESAKMPKFTAQLQSDMKNDPTGKLARKTMARLINGQQWPGEANGWVIDALVSNGVLSLSDPMLWSKNSTIDLTSTTGIPPGVKGFAAFTSFAHGGNGGPAMLARIKKLNPKLSAKKNAINLRAKILSANPKADVTKLNQFIRRGA
jgi:hypothetical protein